MNLYIIILLVINLCFIGLIIVYYKALAKKVDIAFLSQSEDFFKKIDFIFNRMNQHKDLIHKQTIETISPMRNVVESLKSKIEDMERTRIGRDQAIQNSVSNLVKHNDDLMRATEQLALQTSKMLNGFKNPTVRGQWGEIQLQRIVELCGMIPYCEFNTQKTIGSNRPDMIINLPNGGVIYIDSKNPMDAYLKYLEDDDLQKFKRDNVKAFKSHISNLSSKSYWKIEENMSPELVVMFIPLEILWLSALEEDGEILEYTTKRNIMVATPMTLISLLKSINFGWSQLQISVNTEKIKKKLQAVGEATELLNKFTDEIYQAQQENNRKLSKLSDIILKIRELTTQDN